MGIQIKGSNDTISAADGSIVLEGATLTFTNENITGISTMASAEVTGGLKIGTNSVTANVAGDDLKIEGASDRGLSIISGSSSSGNIYFGDSSDADIGRVMYNHNDNALQIYTNAAASANVTIDSGGRVGIGTVPLASEGAEFSIRSSDGQTNVGLVPNTNSQSSQLTFYNATNDSAQGYIKYDNSDNSLQLRVNLAERLRIDSSGRVLMGTTTEGHTSADNLTVADSGDCGITIRSGTTHGASLFFSDATSGAAEYEGYVQYQHNTGSLAFGAAQTQRATLTGIGSFGLGITSPETLLHLESANDGAVIKLQRTGTTIGGSIGVRDESSDKGLTYIAKDGNSGVPAHVFQTNAGSGAVERMRIANDGEVFIGLNEFAITDRSTLLSVAGLNQDPTGSWTQVGLYSTDSQAADKGGSIGFGGQDGTTTKQQFAAIKGAKVNSTSGNYEGYMAFYTRPDGAVTKEQARFTSDGKYNFGHATNNAGSNGRFYVTSIAGQCTMDLHHSVNDNENVLNMIHGGVGVNGNPTRVFVEFRNFANNAVATIQSNSTTVTYNTGSDYRMKENQLDISDGITRVKQLKPYRFNWKSEYGGGDKVDGFFAHEAATVVPEAVQGTKDAVDSNGDIIRQQIDPSKLVPLLTAALKEAITKIETLETKVAALESS